MAINGKSPSELEREANRVRADLATTLEQLRHNLTPANLLNELAESSGLKEVTPERAFDFTVRRHPLPTLMVGMGLAFWAYTSAHRKPDHKHELELERLPVAGAVPKPAAGITEVVGSLAETATKVFRDQADAKSAQFKEFAESHIRSGAEYVSGAIDRTIGDLVAHIPGAPGGAATSVLGRANSYRRCAAIIHPEIHEVSGGTLCWFGLGSAPDSPRIPIMVKL